MVVNFRYDLAELEEMFSQYEHAEDVINSVLHKEGAERIKKEIINILPVSGRHWRGKAKAAKYAQPFTQKDGNLSVTIKSRGKYGYLYFPDDGSNTIKHFGNQKFMQRGAENATDSIVDTILDRLVNTR